MPVSIGRDEVQLLVDDGAQLVEVLPREEHRLAHLPGAISLPLKELDRKTAACLEGTRPVIVYCADHR